jgi:cob(I)alamin adenosyltransferase
MKIYTRTGDRGETGLIGGKRVSKDDPRIVAYGCVDELNSNIGLVISILKNKKLFSDLIDILILIQNELFVVGSDLADPNYSVENEHQTPRIQEKMALHLESVIDRLDEELKPITFFILPGGSIPASSIHVTRSIARRTETAVAVLSKNQTINPALLVYLNRLSDFLFITARIVNKRLEIDDVAWKPSI